MIMEEAPAEMFEKPPIIQQQPVYTAQPVFAPQPVVTQQPVQAVPSHPAGCNRPCSVRIAGSYTEPDLHVHALAQVRMNWLILVALTTLGFYQCKLFSQFLSMQNNIYIHFCTKYSRTRSFKTFCSFISLLTVVKLLNTGIYLTGDSYLN